MDLCILLGGPTCSHGDARVESMTIDAWPPSISWLHGPFDREMIAGMLNILNLPTRSCNDHPFDCFLRSNQLRLFELRVNLGNNDHDQKIYFGNHDHIDIHII